MRLIVHCSCLGAHNVGEVRRIFRKPIYMLFFFWIRKRLAMLQFNHFHRWMWVPDAEFRVFICLSYASLIIELLVISFQKQHVALGAVLAYAIGEVYCLVLNWLLSPPGSVIT